MDKLKKVVNQKPELKSERIPYLQLGVKQERGGVKGTGPHKVKVLDVKDATGQDYKTKEDIKGYEIIVEHEGERKKYFFPALGDDGKFHYLVETFADIPEGSEVIMEYKKKEGTYKGYIDVKPVEEVGSQEQELSDEDIPVVEDDEIPEEYN